MMTKQQAMTANTFHYDGDCHHRWRRNGMTKTWKTRPDEYSVPVKFGLYCYAHITELDNAHVVGSKGCEEAKQ